MAFVKIIMIATMPLFASPTETHDHSTFYKNQTTPEFLLRQLPSAKTEMFFDPSNGTAILEHRKYLEV